MPHGRSFPATFARYHFRGWDLEGMKRNVSSLRKQCRAPLRVQSQHCRQELYFGRYLRGARNAGHVAGLLAENHHDGGAKTVKRTHPRGPHEKKLEECRWGEETGG